MTLSAQILGYKGKTDINRGVCYNALRNFCFRIGIVRYREKNSQGSRHGISVNPYTILEIFFTPPLFSKITKCPSKVKNYRMTKKKNSASFYITELSSKSHNAPLKQKIIARLEIKKFCELSHQLQIFYTNI